MTYQGYPDGVRGIESVFSPVDIVTIVATCPAEDCGFDGDVEAEAWLLYVTPRERAFEYHWTCPNVYCGLEVVEDRVHEIGDDS